MNDAVMQKAKELARLIRFSPEYICMMAAMEAQQAAIRRIP